MPHGDRRQTRAVIKRSVVEPGQVVEHGHHAGSGGCRCAREGARRACRGRRHPRRGGAATVRKPQRGEGGEQAGVGGQFDAVHPVAEGADGERERLGVEPPVSDGVSGSVSMPIRASRSTSARSRPSSPRGCAIVSEHVALVARRALDHAPVTHQPDRAVSGPGATTTASGRTVFSRRRRRRAVAARATASRRTTEKIGRARPSARPGGAAVRAAQRCRGPMPRLRQPARPALVGAAVDRGPAELLGRRFGEKARARRLLHNYHRATRCATSWRCTSAPPDHVFSGMSTPEVPMIG